MNEQVTSDGSALKLDFQHVGRVPPYAHWRMHSSGHPFHELIIVIDGRIEATVGDERLQGSEGDVLYYASGTPHREAADPADPCETIFFAFTGHDRELSELPRKLRDRNGVIRTISCWAYRYRRVSGEIGRELVGSLLKSIICESRHLIMESVNALVERTRKYVISRIAEHITLDELAREAGMSKYHLSRTYKRLCGHPPMEDVTQLRLEHARNLILKTNLPMADIAEQVGFSDSYRLSHVFRRKLKIAPSELRGR